MGHYGSPALAHHSLGCGAPLCCNSPGPASPHHPPASVTSPRKALGAPPPRGCEQGLLGPYSGASVPGSAAFSELEEREGRLRLGPPGGCAHVKDEGVESLRGKATGPASHSFQAMPRAVPRAHTVLHQTGTPPLDPSAAQAQGPAHSPPGTLPQSARRSLPECRSPWAAPWASGEVEGTCVGCCPSEQNHSSGIERPPLAPSQRGRALVQKLPTASWQVWKWGGWGLVFTGLQGRFHPCPSLRP